MLGPHCHKVEPSSPSTQLGVGTATAQPWGCRAPSVTVGGRTDALDTPASTFYHPGATRVLSIQNKAGVRYLDSNALLCVGSCSKGQGNV